MTCSLLKMTLIHKSLRILSRMPSSSGQTEQHSTCGSTVYEFVSSASAALVDGWYNCRDWKALKDPQVYIDPTMYIGRQTSWTCRFVLSIPTASVCRWPFWLHLRPRSDSYSFGAPYLHYSEPRSWAL